MADFDFNNLMENPMFNMGLGLLSQKRNAPIGQGLLAGMQSANQQGLLARQRKQADLAEQQRVAQEQFFAGITPEDIPNVYQKMLNVPGLGPEALKGMAKEPRKIVYQQDAEGNIVALPETMPTSGEISPINTGIKGKRKGETDLEFYQRDPAGFAKYKEAGNRGTGGVSPYYQFFQTGDGFVSGNARTGTIQPVTMNGAPVIPSASDPTLQGKIAKAKAGGRETGKGEGEAITTLKDMEANMPRLETVVSELRDLGRKATYTMAGQAADTARREMGVDVGEGAVARKEYISKVDNEIIPLLRQTFGAQFTQKEGESLKATLGDPNASPEEKNAVLTSFIATKKGQIQSLKRRTELGRTPQGGTSAPGGWGIRRLP